MENVQKCCPPNETSTKRFFLAGILYGLIPHSFCLAFALFSVIGAITVTAFLKKVLLIPNIFYYLILVSIILATVSIYIYLRKKNCLCPSGIKDSWKYIVIVYLTTIAVNSAFFYLVIPALANISFVNTASSQSILSTVSLKVNIPCTGHSFLIIDEVKKDKGVAEVKFIAPDVFEIKYNPQGTTVEKIMAQEVFRTFKPEIYQN